MQIHVPPRRELALLNAGAIIRRALTFSSFALASLACSTANAAPSLGQLLASQCAQCHGTNGSGYESIAGKSFSGLYGDLIEMKNRPVETIMDRQVRGYTDDQLRMISDYFSRLPSSGSDD